MPAAGTVDYLVIVTYLIMMLVIGVVFTRFARTSDDYFRSGSRATWWLVGTSLYMSCFSAWTFTGAAGVAYTAGWSIFCIYAGNFAGHVLNALIYARWFRQLRATTAPEVIAARFDARTAHFYAWVSVLTSLPFAGLTLYSLAIFCSRVFQLDLALTILGAGFALVIYSTIGGSWSVMATDFIQTLILIPVTTALGLLSLWKLGGFGGLINAISDAGLEDTFTPIKPSGAFPNDAYTWAWGAALFFRNMANDLTLTSATRYFSVKDGAAATRAAILCVGLLLLGLSTWFFPAFAARLLYANEVAIVGAGLSKPAEAAYVVAGVHLLPAGFLGLMVVAMFAATMSGLDSGLNHRAAIVVRDIAPMLCRRFNWQAPSAEDELRAGRWVTAILGGIMILLSLRYAAQEQRGIFELMTETAALLGMPMTVPMLLAILFRHTPPWAALVSVVGGFAAALLSFSSKTLFGQPWNLQTTVAVNLATGSGTFLLTLPFWKYTATTDRERIAAFFVRMRTPVDFDREVGAASDSRQLWLLGWFAIAAGGLIELLLLVPNSASSRLVTLCTGGTTVAVGALMVAATIRRRSPMPNVPEQRIETRP